MCSLLARFSGLVEPWASKQRRGKSWKKKVQFQPPGFNNWASAVTDTGRVEQAEHAEVRFGSESVIRF